MLSFFRGYVEEITGNVSRAIERGQPLDELKRMITPETLTSLKVKDMRVRVERELGTLFPVPETPAGMLVASVTSNVEEVFKYFTDARASAAPAPVTTYGRWERGCQARMSLCSRRFDCTRPASRSGSRAWPDPGGRITSTCRRPCTVPLWPISSVVLGCPVTMTFKTAIASGAWMCSSTRSRAPLASISS